MMYAMYHRSIYIFLVNLLTLGKLIILMLVDRGEVYQIPN